MLLEYIDDTLFSNIDCNEELAEFSRSSCCSVTTFLHILLSVLVELVVT